MPEIESTSVNAPVADGNDWVEYYRKKKNRTLKWLLSYSVVVGAVGFFFPEDDWTLDVIIEFPTVILMNHWCYLDASERSRRLSTLTKLALVFAFFLAFPIYLFRTRGLAGFRALALSMLFFVAMIACSMAGGLASYTLAFLGGVELP